MLGSILGPRRVRGCLVVLVTLLVTSTLSACVPPGFHEYDVFEGLQLPTSMELSPDGRVFVTEKRGVVKVFDSVDDTTPRVVADLRTNTFSGWDRGLLDIALPPGFPADRNLYVLYTYDAPPGQQAPRWGRPGADHDNCPDPPGYTADGCVVTGRLSRLPLDGSGVWNGQEQVLLHDWCMQYPSHTVGDMEFAPDGALYVSGGDGASFNFPDYGQRGSPLNPCGDPPVPVGGEQRPPAAEGGALRAQDLRTPGDPVTLDGTVIRIDPATGQGMPDNPLAGSPDANARRIVATGLRNPFRLTLRPGTEELWIGNVGWEDIEEVNNAVGDDATVDNFGWPCYEGGSRQPRYDEVDLAMCENLYAEGTGAVRAPYWAYRHGREVTPDEPCAEGNGSSVSGLAFAPGDGVYPDEYDGALFVADSTRGCIWWFRAGAGGRPDRSSVKTFVTTTAGTPVDLEIGPGGELWYVDHLGGKIRRIGYSASNNPPTAAVWAAPTEGDPPLRVTFNAAGSSDPDPGDRLTYAWDLDDDGAFDDGDTSWVTRTFTTPGTKIVRVRVTDQAGETARALTAVTVGPPISPVPVIDTPNDEVEAAVGDQVAFSGWAGDGAGGFLPPSALSWSADIFHCPDACHRHPGVFSLDGQMAGSFPLPDHGFPSAVELHLTATWEGRSATVSRRVEYQGTELTLASEPAGVDLTVDGGTQAAPFTRSFATNGAVTLSAPATATIDGTTYTFTGWSDGGARTHEITVPREPATYTARYTPTYRPG
jgi:glucose/arabinose dehydrogenase